jgi:hypothetical protein
MDMLRLGVARRAHVFDVTAAPFDLVQITTNVGDKCRVRQKSSKVGRRSSKALREFGTKQRRKSGRLEDGIAGFLVMKQAKLGDEADVGQRDIIAD